MFARTLLVLALLLPTASAPTEVVPPVETDVAVNDARLRTLDGDVVGEAVTGRRYLFEASVVNQGTVAVGAATVSFVLDGTIHTVVVLVALEPRASTLVTSNPWTSVPGKHRSE